MGFGYGVFLTSNKFSAILVHTPGNRTPLSLPSKEQPPNHDDHAN